MNLGCCWPERELSPVGMLKSQLKSSRRVLHFLLSHTLSCVRNRVIVKIDSNVAPRSSPMDPDNLQTDGSARATGKRTECNVGGSETDIRVRTMEEASLFAICPVITQSTSPNKVQESRAPTVPISSQAMQRLLGLDLTSGDVEYISKARLLALQHRHPALLFQRRSWSGQTLPAATCRSI